MKKIILPLVFLLGFSVSNATNSAKYSLESEGKIYSLIRDVDDKRFCKEAIDGQISNDEIGKHVMQQTCRANYLSFNLIQNWGDEIYKIAMTEPKVTNYDYDFPFGSQPNEKLMALSTLKDMMFWTSIERFGEIDKVSKKPKKIKITENQYKFFKSIFEDLKNNNSTKFKPIASPNIGKKFDFKDMAKSKGYINYAQGLVNSKKEAENFENSLKVVFQSFKNYNNYLNYLYNGQIEELTQNPKSFRNHKFTSLQCSAINLAITSDEFKKLQNEYKFTCEK